MPLCCIVVMVSLISVRVTVLILTVLVLLVGMQTFVSARKV